MAVKIKYYHYYSNSDVEIKYLFGTFELMIERFMS